MSSFSTLLQAAPSEIPGWASMGIGGSLAAILFYFYRLDRKSSELALLDLGKQFREVVENNTAALTKLMTTVEGRKL